MEIWQCRKFYNHSRAVRLLLCEVNGMGQMPCLQCVLYSLKLKIIDFTLCTMAFTQDLTGIISQETTVKDHKNRTAKS